MGRDAVTISGGLFRSIADNGGCIVQAELSDHIPIVISAVDDHVIRNYGNDVTVVVSMRLVNKKSSWYFLIQPVWCTYAPCRLVEPRNPCCSGVVEKLVESDAVAVYGAPCRPSPVPGG